MISEVILFQEFIVGEPLKRLFRRDKEFNDWLEKNHAGSTAISDTPQTTGATTKNTTRTAPTAA